MFTVALFVVWYRSSIKTGRNSIAKRKLAYLLRKLHAKQDLVKKRVKPKESSLISLLQEPEKLLLAGEISREDVVRAGRLDAVGDCVP
jgi:hypothetical protein